MMPVMIDAILDSMKMLIRYLPIFITRCIQGITPRISEIREHLDKNPSLATVLNPVIGYDKASEIAKASLKSKQSIRDLLLQQKMFSEEELDALFSRSNMFPSVKLKDKDTK
jgi:fumarate hydratase class II